VTSNKQVIDCTVSRLHDGCRLKYNDLQYPQAGCFYCYRCKDSHKGCVPVCLSTVSRRRNHSHHSPSGQNTDCSFCSCPGPSSSALRGRTAAPRRCSCRGCHAALVAVRCPLGAVRDRNFKLSFYLFGCLFGASGELESG